MIQIDTRQATEEINKIKENLGQFYVNRAMSRAINRTITNERKVSRMAVRAKYNIPSDVANNFNVWNANPNNLTGKLGADSKPIPLHRFNPTFNSGAYGAKVTRKKNKADGKIESSKKLKKGKNKNFANGITVTIIKGQASNIPFAFLGRGGSIPVFAVGMYGQGKGFTHLMGRTPLAKLVTTSLFQAVAGQVPRQEMNKRNLEVYNKNFLSELKFQITKLETK